MYSLKFGFKKLVALVGSANPIKHPYGVNFNDIWIEVQVHLDQAHMDQVERTPHLPPTVIRHPLQWPSSPEESAIHTRYMNAPLEELDGEIERLKDYFIEGLQAYLDTPGDGSAREDFPPYMLAFLKAVVDNKNTLLHFVRTSFNTTYSYAEIMESADPEAIACIQPFYESSLSFRALLRAIFMRWTS